MSLSNYLTNDHGRCDNLFAETENAVASGDWNRAKASFPDFKSATLRHFAIEEDILFPIFEERTGMRAGPTSVMRDEHLQMKDVLQSMTNAVDGEDGDNFLGNAETLLMLMQQHNIKEERILYPMIDQACAGEETALLQRMEAVSA